ncbi:MAG TPA: DUF1385 domain-containing protein [Anaerolineaceae bacterium]|nr:DUF1385 domain-containing protein [Anaerolineaceae bacterium]
MMAQIEAKLRLPSYGGQAVIEGVMMRGKKNLAMACRKPDGSIVTYQENLPPLYQSKLMRIPFLRGIIGLWDALGLGTRMLTKAANYQTGEDEKLEGSSLFFTLLFSLSMAVILFFILPAFVAGKLDQAFNLGVWWGNVIEGLIRLTVLIIYLVLVGRMAEIKRTFMYHGAEHKTINAYEARVELIPEEVARMSTCHPRCGTSFLLTFLVISTFVFALLGPLSILLRLASRVIMLPIIAGIAYEYIQWAAKNMDKSKFVKAIMQPNLWLQKLSTRQPSLDMLEVSINAFKLMLTKEDNPS